MLNHLFSRIIFRIYFLIASKTGGRDGAAARWFARSFLAKMREIPMRRQGLYLELNPVGFVDWCLMVRDGFEPEVNSTILEILKDGGIMLDIGANIGVFSLTAAQLPGVEVIAFEPSPRELRRLHRNVALNPELPISILPFACSSEEGTDTLFQASEDNPGANSMAQTPNTNSSQSITIRKKVPGQLLGQDTLRRVRLVKIDVEGYEHVVLEGLRKTMPDLKASAFIIEINPPCLERSGSSKAAIYDYFAAFGMEGLLGIDTDRTDEDGKFDELFFHPEDFDRSDLLKRLGFS